MDKPGPSGETRALSTGSTRSTRPTRLASGLTRGGLVRKLLLRALIALLALCAVLVLLPPHTIPLEGRLTSIHFFRSNPFVNRLFDVEFHAGIDLASPAGTPVRSTAWGRVQTTGWSDVYGNYVLVAHPLGMRTFYAHMSEVRVREGALLLGGARLGSVGSTGRSTGPHLHLEFRAGRHSLPPRVFLFFHSIRRSVLGF